MLNHRMTRTKILDMKMIEDVKLVDEEKIMPTVEEVTTLSR